MEQETGFKIDGKIYPVPVIDTFTFDELETLYRYCGLTINDWGRRFTPEGIEVWEKGVNHPSFQMALVHVAYRRGNSDVPDGTVSALVRDLVWLDVVEPLLNAQVEPDPLANPESTSAPDKPFESSRSDRNDSTENERPRSGTSSPNDSEKDASREGSTGTSESDTSPTPAPLRQVI